MVRLTQPKRFMRHMLHDRDFKTPFFLITFMALCLFSLPTKAATLSQSDAVLNCYFRLSTQPYDVSSLHEVMSYLDTVIDTFDAVERDYARDAVHFYMPRMRNPKSLIQDLSHALKVIDENPKEGWGNDLRHQLIQVFSDIQNLGLRGTGGSDGPHGELAEYLLGNYDTYRPLLDHFMSAFHSAYFFDPCPAGTPYAFFENIVSSNTMQALIDAAPKPGAIGLSYSDLFKNVGFRTLEGSPMHHRTHYYIGTERPPTVRMIVQNCDPEVSIPVILEFEYNADSMDWQKIDLQKQRPNVGRGLDKYSWFFDDRSRPSVTFRPMVLTEALFVALQDSQEKRFLDMMQQQGISAKMPDISKWDCE